MTVAGRTQPSVCIVAPLPPPYGGMSLQAEKLASRLSKDGIRVRAINTNPPPPASLSWLKRVPGVRTVLRELQYLIFLAHDLDADIVHHFAASGVYFFLQSAPVVLLSKFKGSRTIVNYRGGDAARFLERWGYIVVPIMRLADCIAVPSEFLRQVFAAHGLKTTLLPNIADVSMFTWRRREQFGPKLLCTRNLEPMYNIECLLRAFRRIQHSYPEATLTIVGEGSEAPRLRRIAKLWKLSGVNFSGAITHEYLAAVYASHDIYVNCSNIDNFPGALVEAACCGLPIVTTRAGGIRFMIRDRHNGMLADLDDDEGIAAKVFEIVEDPTLGHALAYAARRWAEQFSWESILPTIMNCYGISDESDAGRDCRRPSSKPVVGVFST